MRIYLLRHTAVAVAKDVCYGRSDVALAASFERDLVEVADKLPADARHPDAVYSSPLQRCLQLAERLYPEVRTDPRLRELDFGAWEGRPWRKIPREQLRVWGEDYVNLAPPGGEAFAELQQRAQTFFAELCARRHRSVTLVSHSGVIVALLAGWLGLPAERAFRLEIDYGGLCAARVQPDWVKIDYVNR